MTGISGDRQLDLFVKARDITSNGHHDWKDCLVVGELTKSDMSTTSKEKLIQLATYVRHTFSAQPLRRFVHAFLIFSVQMQQWVFDRSGAYSSSPFNIRQEPQRFVRVLTGYAWMSVEELGLDTFIKRNGLCPVVTLSDPLSRKASQFRLKDEPFFQQPAIVCRGTTCYQTTDEQHVVKFSWRPDKQRSEVDHLAKAQGVRGVPVLKGSSTITTINDLRSGLKFRKQRKLGHIVYEKPDDVTQLSFTSQSTQQLESFSVGGTKRKTDLRNESPTKRSRSNSQRSSLHHELRRDEVEQPQTSNMPPPTSPQRNRILTCIAMAPQGDHWSSSLAFAKC